MRTKRNNIVISVDCIYATGPKVQCTFKGVHKTDVLILGYYLMVHNIQPNDLQLNLYSGNSSVICLLLLADILVCKPTI